MGYCQNDYAENQSPNSAVRNDFKRIRWFQ
jgi:hypothetical protein